MQSIAITFTTVSFFARDYVTPCVSRALFRSEAAQWFVSLMIEDFGFVSLPQSATLPARPASMDALRAAAASSLVGSHVVYRQLFTANVPSRGGNVPPLSASRQRSVKGGNAAQTNTRQTTSSLRESSALLRRPSHQRNEAGEEHGICSSPASSHCARHRGQRYTRSGSVGNAACGSR